MTGSHEHSAKTIAVSYIEKQGWEVWSLRFNRGRKLNKPVKFFASLKWRLGTAGVPFGGTHWDFASEKEAEAWFAASVAEYGGVVEPVTHELLAKVKALGYVPT